MPHLTAEQRYTISCILSQGNNQPQIARTIGKHKSVVSRARTRNKDQRSGLYRADLAHRKYAKRQKEKPKHVRFTPEVGKYVEARLTRLMLKMKKAHPYHSWERGSNENLNGLIRHYFPKKIDFNQTTDKEIQNAETKLNNRPRKRFKHQTPIFVRNQLLFSLKVEFVA